MPDSREHRGAHPQDAALFAPPTWSVLRAAVHDFSWLLTRGYAVDSGLALVGNRYSLVGRQRAALSRMSCSDQALSERARRRLEAPDLQGRVVRVDGFNVCITLEVALSGGLLLVGRDGAFRDLASVHGTYRRVSETPRALELLVQELAELGPEGVTWFLDRPVSNSGSLAGLLREQIDLRGLNWQVELVTDVDRQVAAPSGVALSADSGVIEKAEAWFDLAAHTIAKAVPSAWKVTLG